jgi:hypothetical protein
VTVVKLTQRDGKRTIFGMALEPDPESLPDDPDEDVGEDQALLTERMHIFLDAFNDVMVAIHALKGAARNPRGERVGPGSR